MGIPKYRIVRAERNVHGVWETVYHVQLLSAVGLLRVLGWRNVHPTSSNGVCWSDGVLAHKHTEAESKKQLWEICLLHRPEAEPEPIHTMKAEGEKLRCEAESSNLDFRSTDNTEFFRRQHAYADWLDANGYKNNAIRLILPIVIYQRAFVDEPAKSDIVVPNWSKRPLRRGVKTTTKHESTVSGETVRFLRSVAILSFVWCWLMNKRLELAND